MGVFDRPSTIQKQGTPPDIENNQLPRTLIRCKPDWHAAEVVSPRHTDYYESNKALGFLFRSIKIDEQPIIPLDVAPVAPLSDPISIALLATVEPHLGSATFVEHHPLSLLRYIPTLR